MQQVFSLVNELLHSNQSSSSLTLRTYKVIPLSQRSGLLEWCEGTIPLGELHNTPVCYSVHLCTTLYTCVLLYTPFLRQQISPFHTNQIIKQIFVYYSGAWLGSTDDTYRKGALCRYQPSGTPPQKARQELVSHIGKCYHTD